MALSVVPVDLDLLFACHEHGMIWGIPYVWGGKPDPSLDTSQIHGSDCSGWFRYLLARQGWKGLVVGTAEDQMSQLQGAGLALLSREQYLGGPGAWGRVPPPTLSAWFILPVAGGHAGHVWMVYNDPAESLQSAFTLECHGGVGVNERPWNTRVLLREVHAGFVLPVK